MLKREVDVIAAHPVNFPGRCRRSNFIYMLLVASGCLLPLAAMADELERACCADLDARIEELAATAPAGAQLDVEISGQLHRAVLFWSDGTENNSYIVDPSSGGSYFTFTGDVEILPKWDAGFMLEIEVPINESSELSQSLSSSEKGIGVGASNFFISHDDFGTLTLGKQTEAHDHITELDLSRTDDFANPAVTDWNGTFGLRQTSTGRELSPGLPWSLSSADDIGDGEEAPVIRFDTPEEQPLQASVSWGMGGVSAAALRLEDTWGDVSVWGGAAFAYYAEDTRSPCRRSDALADCGTVAGSLSLKHNPTGIIAGGAIGFAAIDPANASGKNHWHYLKLARAWSIFELGETTTYVEYFHGGRSFSVAFDEVNRLPVDELNLIVDIDVWGAGVMQSIKGSDIDFYLAFRNYEINVTHAGSAQFPVQFEPFSAVMGGSRITF